MQPIPLRLESHNCYGMTFPFYVSYDVIDIPIRLHRHDFVELQMTVAGHGTERVNGISHELQKGNLTILFPWHCHDIMPDPDGKVEIIKCCFDTEMFLQENSPFIELKNLVFYNLGASPFTTFEDAASETIIGLFDSLLKEFSEYEKWKEVLFKSIIAQIFILFDRHRSKTAVPSQKDSDGSRIWDIIEYINLHYNEDIRLADVAAKFYYSSSRLNKLIKEHTNLTFDDLLTETRIRNACAMLIYHKTSVSYIAAAVGYQSEETFFRTFKNIKGISPGNYRKSHVEQKQNMVFPLCIDAKIIYYLHKHYAEDISPASVANAFHYSEGYLCDVLKSQTGQSFLELLHEIRIFHAGVLLLTSDMPVNQIGFEVGFNSTETFLRVFKKIKGIPPGAYRKSGGTTENAASQ